MSQPVKIGQLLPKALNRIGVAEAVQAAQICACCEKILAEDYPQYAKESQATKIRHKTLVIEVKSSPLAQELQMCQHIILEKINQKMGRVLVERIVFRLN